MPITSSAKKALRRDRRRQAVNYRIRAKMKKALDVIGRGSNSLEDISNVQSVLDTAVKKKVLHKNKAARLKSRLITLVKSRGGSDMSASSKKKTAPKSTSKKVAPKKAVVKKAAPKKVAAKKPAAKKAAPKKAAAK